MGLYSDMYDPDPFEEDDEEDTRDSVQIKFNSIVHETEKAILVEFLGHGKLWIPLSQVQEIHTNPDGTGAIAITAWIAKQKGL